MNMLGFKPRFIVITIALFLFFLSSTSSIESRPAPEIKSPLVQGSYIKLHFSSVPQRGAQLGENYLVSTEPDKILLKSRKFIPDKNIYSDARAKLLQNYLLNEKTHLFIRFDEIKTTEEKQSLSERGINLLEYIPEKTYVASVQPYALLTLEKRSGISFIDPIFPADKIEPALKKNGIAPWAQNTDGTANMTLLFYSDVSQDEARKVIEKYGAVLEPPAYEGSNAWLVRIGYEKIRQIINEELVAYIGNGPSYAMPGMSVARAVTQVNEVQAAPYNLDGDGIVIAMWDLGMPNHIDLNSRKVPGSDNPTNPDWHATMVAGIMVGDGSNSASKGYAPFQWRGVATKATVRYYDRLPGTITSFYDEMVDAASNNAVISQNSWLYIPAVCIDFGSYWYISPSYDTWIDTGLAGGKKINVVHIAANFQKNYYDGTPHGCGSYDTLYGGGGATAKNPIVVGAVRGNNEEMTEFSSWGPTDDGRTKPDLVAVGDWSGGVAWSMVESTNYIDDGYTEGWGTSFAAPQVSGIIALMIQDWRTISHVGQKDPAPSTIKAILLHTAKDKETTGPDYKTGYGLAQAKNAIDLIRADNPIDMDLSKIGITIDPIRTGLSKPNLIWDNIPINHGEQKIYKIYIPPAQKELKATLVWDDVAGSPYAAKELVNDLDLIVLDPYGNLHYPWTLDPLNPATPATQNKPNTLDNVEQVLVKNPISGEWKVIVQGTSVPSEPEYFSLVRSNFTEYPLPIFWDCPQDSTFCK